MAENETPISKNAKNFSDYLGFHVRIFFCLSVAMTALARPLQDLLSKFEAGQEYRATEHWVELSVMLLFGTYAITMIYLVLQTMWRFVDAVFLKRWFRVFFGLPIKIGLSGLILLSMAAISLMAAVQISRALGVVDLAAFQCALNGYLSATNYPFTPPRPVFCDIAS